ncbi:MAG: malto-oligosyltrehalose trehalohydrolase [Verrucomicrobiaceae bacterium]|nr:MAG: malto-oligosyltrehalose trehalohydrolase [Verrucomicrobiaceae bacterium]
MMSIQRRLPIGAEVQETGVHFRVWAPDSHSAHVVVYDSSGRECVQALPMQAEDNGYFACHIPDLGAGTLYRIRLDAGDFPDPASRFQPEGPHGPSQIVDPGTFQWTDRTWKGSGRDGQVLYEMHIGTFTPEGTWAAAAEQLEELANLGITVLEVMPVSDFPGRFGWGYDGVNLYAPTRLYGTPDEFRAFVDRAHRAGIGVILDVVYNHLGPDGNYLNHFSRDYFSSRYKNEWGEALNFDGKNSDAVREFFIENAGYWIEEYHLDGLRLDATQQIFDQSPEHLVTSITRKVRASGGNRATYLVAENEPQHIRLVQPIEEGGHGMDALWNDDFHHSAIVALIGKNEAYYTDYRGEPQEFISAAKYGYLYQGQLYKWQKKRRGASSLHAHPANFVAFIQNHDQIANSLWGQRIHTISSAGPFRAMTALLLLGPNTPMLFQGQEFGATTPFLYFADHNPELAKLVAKGRREFISQFPSIAALKEKVEEFIAEPELEETFLRCKLNFSEREENAAIYQLHKDLLHLRRTDPVFARPRYRGVDGACISECTFLLRFFGEQRGDDRLLIVNFGVDLHLDPAPEPLLAPPAGAVWDLLWTSEDPKYGGLGTPPVETDENWRIPGRAAVVLTPKAINESPSTDAHEQAGP